MKEQKKVPVKNWHARENSGIYSYNGQSHLHYSLVTVYKKENCFSFYCWVSTHWTNSHINMMIIEMPQYIYNKIWNTNWVSTISLDSTQYLIIQIALNDTSGNTSKKNKCANLTIMFKHRLHSRLLQCCRQPTKGKARIKNHLQ